MKMARSLDDAKTIGNGPIKTTPAYPVLTSCKLKFKLSSARPIMSSAIPVKILNGFIA
jgi:hypothetical protein